MSYSKKRYFVYTFITIFTFVLPFIKINGNHILLLSFDKMQFHFFGLIFNMNELYVMPFLLMFMFIGIFAITTILGRLWCGWACPQTIFRVIYRDLIESTILDLRRIKNKQNDINYSKNTNKIKKYISLLLWIIISLIISTNFMWYFVPPEDFFTYITNPMEHLFMITFIVCTAMFLFFDIVFAKENFCTYVCPYSRIQSVLYDDDTKQIVYDTNRGGAIYNNGAKTIFNTKQWSANEECTTCEACVKICPTHIDIRKGLQVECINCLECSDACASVQSKLGRKSLIEWGSTNSVLKKINHSIFSKRNNLYFLALLISLILAGFFMTQKQNILLNINRTTKLYSINDEQKVSNNYILTIQNSSDRKYTYDIKVEDNSNFRIKRFTPFSLEANKRAKKIFILEAKKMLALSNKKDSTLKTSITIFAKEDNSITLTKELVFIYPRSDLVK